MKIPLAKPLFCCICISLYPLFSVILHFRPKMKLVFFSTGKIRFLLFAWVAAPCWGILDTRAVGEAEVLCARPVTDSCMLVLLILLLPVSFHCKLSFPRGTVDHCLFSASSAFVGTKKVSPFERNMWMASHLWTTWHHSLLDLKMFSGML